MVRINYNFNDSHEKVESAKSRAWRARVFVCLTCLRAWCVCVLTSLHAWRVCVLVCACFAYVLPMMHAWRVYH